MRCFINGLTFKQFSFEVFFLCWFNYQFLILEYYDDFPWLYPYWNLIVNNFRTNFNIYLICSDIFCQGKLLKTVQEARIFDDSKTFVDMKLKHPPNETIQRFNKFMSQHNDKPSKKNISQFVSVSIRRNLSKKSTKYDHVNAVNNSFELIFYEKFSSNENDPINRFKKSNWSRDMFC